MPGRILKAAMPERAKEVKAAKRGGKRSSKADGESDLLAKIAEVAEPDRPMAERLHAIITAGAPDLSPKTWYGMPAYAKDGATIRRLRGDHPRSASEVGRSTRAPGASVDQPAGHDETDPFWWAPFTHYGSPW